ncbi:Free methionine-R-sulfoxide reductase [Wickerhamiella sorbophila]|uniref:Free methionine-R-sulfoxide reductase n=1 Tax=Wickerhamiella sorbophila TaxID=45607 RepID=A0A2T0FE39_9ASCO|nr:Free methionine-R-sulfoxide reductase [Wickerhamiella sorbophila]PRT53262.1 Free methionine-R-sulfoxide reductase [Wickerhamiella sorbophila]
MHADNANFQAGLSKVESYEMLVMSLEGLLVENWVSNLANTASLLWHHFHSQPSPQKDVNWAGFYTTATANQLALGPFMGKVACQTIDFGRGVCGAAAATGKTQIVQNVHSHPDHIACDGDTKSEIVVPIINEGRIVGVIDIDCTELNGFDQVDAEWLEKIARLLAPSFKASTQ